MHVVFTWMLSVFHLVGLTAIFLPGSLSLQWSDNLPDGVTVYVCDGSNLRLPWNISQAAAEGIADIQWFAATGSSQEMMAMYAHGHFLVLPTFSGRVKHVETAGLVLEAVEMAEAGNYSVVVTGHDGSGAFFKSSRTAVVKVAGDLMTTDGSMHVTKEATAVWDNSNQQYHFVLSCGTFTYTTHPPFEVEWTLPDGTVRNSTRYVDGKFQLQLPNPIQGGNYTCLINQKTAIDACLPGHVPKHVVASTDVNSVDSRLAILEAQQAALLTKQEELKAENSRLKGHNDHLKNDLDHVQSQLTQYINNTREQSQVSFQASMPGSGSIYVDTMHPISLSNVTNNQGNSFDPSSGKFTAPVRGTYFFAATVWTANRNGDGRVEILKNGISICHVQSTINGDSASCQVVVSLKAGDLVWLQFFEYRGFRQILFGADVTSLTGFLINTEQRPISFQARLHVIRSKVVSSESTVPLEDVLDNQGNAFNASSSKFTAPVSGIYFFAATAWMLDRSHGHAALVVDGTSTICWLLSMVNGDSASCQTVVSLNAGQEVWMKSISSWGGGITLSGENTPLTGFLVSARF